MGTACTENKNVHEKCFKTALKAVVKAGTTTLVMGGAQNIFCGFGRNVV